MRLPSPFASLRTALGRLLAPRVSDGPRIQVGTWSDGGIHTLVAIAQCGETATAYVYKADPATHVWTWGIHGLVPCPSHHDLATVAAAIRQKPLRWRCLYDLGLVGAASHPPLASSLVYVLRGGPNAKVSEEDKEKALSRVRGLGTGPGRTLIRIGMTADMRRQYGIDSGRSPADPEAYGFKGRETPSYSLSGSTPRPPPIPAPGTGLPVGAHAFPDALDTDRDVLAARVSEILRSAIGAGMAVCHRREISDLLGTEGWSPEGYAWYADEGPLGDRRRQAAAIYPGLAPMLAAIPEIGAAIDAGKPFEEPLRKELQALCRPEDTLTQAAVRRLRTLPLGPNFSDVATLVQWAARLPLDWLPTTEDGWQDLNEILGRAQHLISMGAYDLSDLARETGRDWRTMIGLGNPSPSPNDDLAGFLGALTGGWDMAHHLRETLVSPVARSIGLPERSSDATLLASRILFGGKSARSVARQQERWHAARTVLEAALPCDRGVNAWPVPFQPFVAPDGLTITCLANDAALMAEGGEGPDAEGIDGLAHCVGGYGRRCYVGESVIASVRRIDPDGRPHRVSTIEFLPRTDAEGNATLAPWQHKAASNAEPPPEAVQAVDALIAAISDGSHPLDRESLAPRDGNGFIDAYDWRRPGALDQAFAAWQPHLPEGMARAGLAALVERIRRDTADWPREPETLRQGLNAAFTRMLVLAEGIPGGVALRRGMAAE